VRLGSLREVNLSVYIEFLRGYSDEESKIKRKFREALKSSIYLNWSILQHWSEFSKLCTLENEL
jgi:hypothetical protein